MKPTIALILTIMMTVSASSFQDNSGSVCVAAMPDRSGEIRRAGIGAVECNGTLKLKIDSGKIIPWPIKQAVKINALDLTTKHRVVAYCDEKPIQSFHFRYSEFKAQKLCLFINDLYWNMQLWEAKSCPWCKCK